MPYVIGGRPVQLGEEPKNMNGPIFVPLRDVMEAIGGTVGWDKASNSATAQYQGKTARIFPNTTTVNVDGAAPKQMSVPPYMTEGSTWVPVEFFEAFGITAIADAASNTVTVNT